jgi:hypothetical protein
MADLEETLTLNAEVLRDVIALAALDESELRHAASYLETHDPRETDALAGVLADERRRQEIASLLDLVADLASAVGDIAERARRVRDDLEREGMPLPRPRTVGL